MNVIGMMGSMHRHVLFWVIVLSTVYGAAWSMEKKEGGESDFEVLQTPNDTVTVLFVGATGSIFFTIIEKGTEEEFSISLEILNDDFDLSFEQVESVSQSNSSNNLTLKVNITGTKLVISEFKIVAMKENRRKTVLLTHYVKVKRVPNQIAVIIRYLVSLATILAIWLIGITTELNLIYAILRRPFPLFIGIICQFVIMPFNAWSLTKIFQIDDPASLGLVLFGTCPGGSNSNLFSVLLDVDYVLSITMTLFSTIVSLGMMPLNLLIYGSSYVAAGETIRTPFLEIFLQLVLIVGPLAIGIFLGWKWPKVRHVANRYIKPVSAVALVTLFAVDLPFNLYIFDSPWQYYISSLIFPLIGAIAGLLISKIVRLSTRKAITVAIETGVQNALVAATVLTFFYPQPESDLAIRLPYVTLIFMTSEGIILVGMYTLLKHCYWHGIPYKDDGDTVDDKDVDPEKSWTDTNEGKPNSSSEVAGNPSEVVLVSTVSRKDNSLGHSNRAFNKFE